MKTPQIALILALLLFGYSGMTQSGPGLINYQGRLTDQGGSPLAPGLYSVQFRVWDSTTATNSGDLVWAQQQSVAVASNGLFNAILGSSAGTQISGVAGTTTNLAAAFSAGSRYLGVTVVNTNGSPSSEISPRQQLLAVPYALNGVPSGGILMWSGLSGQIPVGWALCDGNNGTPNLTNKFILAAASLAQTDQQGGSLTHNHGGTTGNHTLTVPEMPSHTHSVPVIASGAGAYGNGHFLDQPGQTGSAGGDQPHNHPISSDSNVPPYYTLAFIMKL